MKYITDIGISNDFPIYINHKIKISNQVALLMAGVGVCYTVFSIFFYPQLTIYPVFCIALSLGAIVLNLLEYHLISRFILSVLVILLAYIYHGFLTQPGEYSIASMYVIEIALSVIPWVLIDFREKKLLSISLVACFVLIFSQPVANEFLQLEVDSTMFRKGWLSLASYGFGVMIIVSCLIFTQRKNYISEIKNEKLLVDIGKYMQSL